MPEPAETPVRAVASEGSEGPPPDYRRRRLLLIPILVVIWIAVYLSMGEEQLSEGDRAQYCRTADEIEVLTEEELLVYQDPPGEGQEPDDVIREQFQQTAARMVLLYARLGESAPRDLHGDIEETAIAYQQALRSRNPAAARDLRNSEASKRIDAYTEANC